MEYFVKFHPYCIIMTMFFLQLKEHLLYQVLTNWNLKEFKLSCTDSAPGFYHSLTDSSCSAGSCSRAVNDVEKVFYWWMLVSWYVGDTALGNKILRHHSPQNIVSHKKNWFKISRYEEWKVLEVDIFYFKKVLLKTMK